MASVLIDAAFLDRDQVLAGHQFVDLLTRVGSKTDIAVGENADKAARNVTAAVLDHRNAGNAVGFHQRQSLGQRRIRTDRYRVDHHAAFELLDLTDLLGLFDRRQVAVDDADAACLRHGDGKPAFRHRVHGRGDDRQVEFNILGDSRGDIRLARHHFGMAGLQEHVVEGQRICAGCGFNDACHGQIPSI